MWTTSKTSKRRFILPSTVLYSTFWIIQNISSKYVLIRLTMVCSLNLIQHFRSVYDMVQILIKEKQTILSFVKRSLDTANFALGIEFTEGYQIDLYKEEKQNFSHSSFLQKPKRNNFIFGSWRKPLWWKLCRFAFYCVVFLFWLLTALSELYAVIH